MVNHGPQYSRTTKESRPIGEAVNAIPKEVSLGYTLFPLIAVPTPKPSSPCDLILLLRGLVRFSRLSPNAPRINQPVPSAMDSYRPGTDRGRRGVPSRDSYRPRRYDDEQRNGDDPWPPRNNRDDMFYFTAGDDHDRNRNRPRDEPPYRSRPRHQAQGARGRGRDQFRRPYPPSHHAKVSERPLLRMAQDAIEDPSLLQNGTGDKFRAVDDLTDSEEEEMAQSEDEEQGRTKRIRVHRGDADSAPAPKWSNPDPYTSLPLYRLANL